MIGAILDGEARRAADLGPWEDATSGHLIESTMQRLRQKGLALVPVRGGEPELTDAGREAWAAHQTRAAGEAAKAAAGEGSP